MKKRPRLDSKDLALVRLLEADAWITHAEAGEIVHLSPSAVQRRIERLRADGVITGATATVDKRLTGKGLRIYLLLELNNDSQKGIESVRKDLERCEEVTQADLVSGKFDLILTLDCADTDSFSEFAMNKINTNKNIRHCWTLMRLKRIALE